MIEVKGDLWSFDATYRCITTNGELKNNGRAVMGRGCALEAKEKYPDIDKILGDMIRVFGNHVHELGWAEEGVGFFAEDVLSFPVKYNWSDPADIKLIERSANELFEFIEDRQEAYDNKITCVIPRPGCGYGGLNWEDVKPVLEPYFDDRFYVITFE